MSTINEFVIAEEDLAAGAAAAWLSPTTRHKSPATGGGDREHL